MFSAITTRTLRSLLASALLLGATASCSDDRGIDGPVEMQLWDIATYEGSGTQGGSVFTFRQVDDSPLITLTSDRSFEKAESGDRMALRYIPESGKAYTSGPVRLLSASKVTQSDVDLEWKEEFDAWDRDKVYVYSVWRSGDYINFNVRLTYSSEPRIFRLAVPPESLDSDMPDVYLVHIMAEETDNHDRAYLASFQCRRAVAEARLARTENPCRQLQP